MKKTITHNNKQVEITLTKFQEKQILEATQNIMDKIKTFDDVLAANKMTEAKFYDMCGGLSLDEVAYRKLKLVATALNEGWTPDWNNSDQQKYIPYFDMRTDSGFGFSHTHYDLWFTCTYVGSRLCFKSSDLAMYAGEQFLAEYRDFLTIQ